MNDKEFADNVHIQIHAVRLLPNYKPSELEIRISKLVLEKYGNTCQECKDVKERLSKQPPKKSFFSKLGDVITDD